MLIAVKTMAALFLCLVMISACGQKGPLFLPGDPAAIKTDVPGQHQSEPSPATTDEDAENEDDDEQQK